MKSKALLGVTLAWVAIYAIFAVLQPQTFLSLGNIELMMRQSIIVGIASIGMTYVILTGGIDLSAGSTIALTTVATAISLKSQGSPVVAILVGLMVGVLVGLLNGFIVAKGKVTAFIVTLASMLAVRGIAKGLAKEQTISSVPSTWIETFTAALGKDSKWQLIPLGAWVWVLLVVLMALVLRFTVFGRHTLAVGSNEKTAVMCGLPVDRIKVSVYVLSGLFAAIAGVMQFARSTIGDPTAASGLELQIIAAVVIGGASLSGGEGSIVGSAIGALIMTTINMGCAQMGVPNWIQEMLTGGIILVAVGLDRWRLARKVAVAG